MVLIADTQMPALPHGVRRIWSGSDFPGVYWGLSLPLGYCGGLSLPPGYCGGFYLHLSNSRGLLHTGWLVCQLFDLRWERATFNPRWERKLMHVPELQPPIMVVILLQVHIHVLLCPILSDNYHTFRQLLHNLLWIR